MATVINERTRRQGTLPTIFFDIFPPYIYDALRSLVREGIVIEEVRVRADRRLRVTSEGRNIDTDCFCSRETVQSLFSVICEDSVYAHADTINQGYVTLAGGIRVGIAGRAAVERGRIVGVYDVCSLCFRVPHTVRGVGGRVCSLVEELSGAGVLIYSPPGEGKTTLLRGVVSRLATERQMRIAVIDSRDELGACLTAEELCVDLLSGYPKAAGIEIAARCLNPQLIVCDEIGESEAEAIVGAMVCGVPVLASAHGGDLAGLLARDGMRRLHLAGVFGAYVGIRRRRGERDFTYDVKYYGEADGYIQTFRGASGGA